MIFVHKLFDIVISKGFRQDNPCDAIRNFQKSIKKMSYYTPEQFKEFESYFEESEYPLNFYIVYHVYGNCMGRHLP